MRVHPAGALIAVILGGGVMRLWDHRDSGVLERTSVQDGESAVVTPAARPHFARALGTTHFLRGNLHSHTTRSDGDASPADVERWYARNGYSFVALTDHNVLSTPSDGDDERATRATADFTRIAGEEITMRAGGRQVHVNALCTHATIEGGTYDRAGDALEHAVGEVRGQDGVALVNHPNFDWALAADDIVAADGAQLLEIASGHPYVHTAGDATHRSHEQLWDDVLTRGEDIMGVAVDDTHHLVTDADPEAFPGVAWVEVFGDVASPGLICDALRRGDLYASTGAVVLAIDVHADRYSLRLDDPAAVVVFVGRGGRTLARKTETNGEVSYRLVGDEAYVRARVETLRGFAWTPAVRVDVTRP